MSTPERRVDNEFLDRDRNLVKIKLPGWEVGRRGVRSWISFFKDLSNRHYEF